MIRNEQNTLYMFYYDVICNSLPLFWFDGKIQFSQSNDIIYSIYVKDTQQWVI